MKKRINRQISTFACALAVLLLSVGSALAEDREGVAPGTLLWENRWHQGTHDHAKAVAAADGNVAVFGRSFDPRTGTSYDTVLRLYDAATGVLRWDTRFDLAHHFDEALGVTIAGPVVLTLGASFNASFHYVWIVSAHNISSGVLLWRDELQEGAGDFLPGAVAVHDGRAYVTGVGGESCSAFDVSNCDQITRSYDVGTGALLWENRYDAAGADDDALSVATTDDLVIVGGSVGSVPNDEITGPSVRALNAETGQLVWQDTLPDPTNDGFVWKVVAKGGRVFMAAMDNDDWLVRAYDAHTGRVRWTNTYSLVASTPGVFDAPVQMAVGENVVAVGGYGSTIPNDRNSRDWVVNTYDARSGRVLWSDHLGVSGNVDEVNGGMVIAGGQAIAFGSAGDSTGKGQWLVRSYDARRGQVRWQDRVVEGNPNSGPWGIVIGLSASRGKVTAAGFINVQYPGFVGSEWLVRTYAVGKAEEEDDVQAEQAGARSDDSDESGGDGMKKK